MYFMVYASSATKEFTQEAMNKLLEISRKNNTELNVTGMLLHKDGNFIQVLEGEKPVVKQLFNKIGRDSRHRGILVLEEGEIEKRSFSEWSMGFYNLSTAEAIDLPGYSEYMNTSFSSDALPAPPSIAHELLLTFKQNMR